MAKTLVNKQIQMSHNGATLSSISKIRFDFSQASFLFLTIATAVCSMFFIGYIFYSAAPVLMKEGFGFILGSEWDYATNQYGILQLISGTIIMTIVTMVIACPLSILTAIFLAEFSHAIIRNIMRPMIELLVGIPSVVYGLFGFYVLSDVFKHQINPFIDATLGFIPIFKNVNPDFGFGILLASSVLAIMVMPTIISLSEESIRAVAAEQREASYALGATKWETIKKLILPSASPGILTGVLLGMTRAMGETMAIVMLIGNVDHIPSSILDTAYVMTSKIVNEIGYWVYFDEPRSALLGIAAVLFVMEFIFIISARIINRKSTSIRNRG